MTVLFFAVGFIAVSASRASWCPVITKPLLTNSYWRSLCCSLSIKALQPGSDCTATREDTSSVWFGVCVNGRAGLWTRAGPSSHGHQQALVSVCIGQKRAQLTLRSSESAAPPFHLILEWDHVTGMLSFMAVITVLGYKITVMSLHDVFLSSPITSAEANVVMPLNTCMCSQTAAQAQNTHTHRDPWPVLGYITLKFPWALL